MGDRGGSQPPAGLALYGVDRVGQRTAAKRAAVQVGQQRVTGPGADGKPGGAHRLQYGPGGLRKRPPVPVGPDGGCVEVEVGEAQLLLGGDRQAGQSDIVLDVL